MSAQALYMPETPEPSRAPRRRFWKAIITALLSTLFIVTGVAQNAATVAYANSEDDAKKKLEESQKNFDIGEKNDKGFAQSLEKAKGDQDRNSFGYVINRVITPHYLNETPQSAIDGQYSGEKKYNCKWDDPHNGSLVYHNCDVPNFTAEFYQKLYDTFIPSGVLSGTTESATIDTKWFGLPTELPNDTVPADPGSRQAKYTGLELFGYNLRYSVYAGEYDSIKVDTQARMMANFGLSQSFALGTQTIIQGISGGLERAGQRTSEEWKKGNYVGAFFAGIGGFFEGAAASSVNTILDTSDANVFATRGWSRVGFGKTVYGARELSYKERETELLKIFSSLFQDLRPEDSQVPEDLNKLKTPPSRPNSGGTTCTWSDGNGEHKDKDVSEADCKQHDGATWEKEGEKRETIKDWKNKNKEFFAAADKYNLGCPVDEEESKRDETIAGFYSCYPDAFQKVWAKEAKTADNDAVREFIKESLSAWVIQDRLKNTKALNNPAFSYVCVDARGDDMLDGEKHAYVFNEDGSYTGKCGVVRSPIQDGVYGNGYSKPVPKDTRRELFDPSVSRVFFDAPIVTNGVANASLALSAFMTRVSNTFLNLSFSPILKTFGADKIIVNMMVAFRDSLFFPLIGIIVFSVIIYYMATSIRGGTRRLVMMMFSSILIALFGAIIFARPQQVVSFIDYTPSIIASDLVSTIVGNGTDDELCQADGDTDFTMVGTKGDGNVTGVARGNRMLMCENWRLGLFNYWVYGQWGTDFHSLYAAGKPAPDGSTLTNSNSNLVGNAGVNMGAGRIVNNWAVYQLDTMTAGTTVEKDTRGVGEISKDMYRMVDVQAGPNNGAGTDGRFLKNWSNQSWGNRVFVALTAPIGSLVLAATVSIYSAHKIIVTIIAMFYLAVAPLVFMLAPIGLRGRFTLKNWAITLLGLIVQIIALIVLLALMMFIIVSIGNGVHSYLPMLLGTSVTAGIFLFYRKKLLQFVTVGSGVGGSLQAGDVRNFTNKYAPESVKNLGVRYRLASQGARSGFVAGLKQNGLRGGFRGAIFGAQSARNNMAFKSNVGATRTVWAATQAGKRQAEKDLRSHTVDRERLGKEMSALHTHQSKLETGEEPKRDLPDTTKAKGMRTMLKASKLAADRDRKLAQVDKTYRAQKAEQNNGVEPADRLDGATLDSVSEDVTTYQEEQDAVRADKERINSEFLTQLNKLLGGNDTRVNPTHVDTLNNRADNEEGDRTYSVKDADMLLRMSTTELSALLEELENTENPDRVLIVEIRRILKLKEEQLK